MQFVQSILLFAAAGIIVPVVIHLWNVKQGKTLKVGSIAFLTESAKSHAKSLQLSDLLLLLLRCLLLIVLAILIAKPYYEKQLEDQKEKGWVLIEKSKVHEVYNKYKVRIDTLLKRGYTFHYFNPDFKQAILAEVLQTPNDTAKQEEFSYWTLLKELDQKVPARLPVEIFTDNSLRRFSGTRPTVSLRLKWTVYSSPDTTATWMEKAYLTTNDSIRLIVGHSNASGTYYTHQNLSSSNSNSQFTIKAANGKKWVTYNDSARTSTNKTVEVDTAALAITIYSDKFGEDANYVRAAINAIKDFTKYKIKVRVVKSVAEIPANYNWLFWLSEETMPAALMRKKVFVYEKGKVESLRSPLVAQDEVDATANEPVWLFKSIRSNSPVSPASEAIWKNGFGGPVLSLEKKQSGIYHFYSRFNPQWNDLPWSNQFPQIIYNLIFSAGKSQRTNEADKRIIDPSQIQPVMTAGATEVKKESLTERKDLSKLFWLLALMLFVLERMLSMRRKKEEVYG